MARLGVNNSGEGAERGTKKGPWTAAEDAMLAEYVRRYGEGNWNAVQKNSGLSRCGKSCRLRWANHLRPNLKKGTFSPEEERTIIDLHSRIGNKWARMASQLPGRTDNEIKNFWNTRTKRRQRAGLPLYPNTNINININNNSINNSDQLQQINQITPSLQYSSSSSSSSSSSPSLLSPNNNNSLYNHHLISGNNNSHNNTNPYGFSLPASQVNQIIMPFSHLIQTNTNNFSPLFINPYFNYYNINNSYYNIGNNPNPMILAAELPSSQTPATSDHDSNTPCGFLSDLVGGGDMGAFRANVDEEDEDDVARSKLAAFGNENDASEIGGVAENFSSCDQSSVGIVEQSEGPVDEDLMSLLNHFQSSATPEQTELYLAAGKSDRSTSCWYNMH